MEANQYVKRNETLSQQRQVWDSFCQEIANYVMPRKGQITETDLSPDSGKYADLFDTTAVQSNMILANGQTSMMTPMEEQWFYFDMPDGDDEAKQWFTACTNITRRELSNSNFYTEMHELYLDRGAFGTAILFAEAGKKSALRFSNHDVGTYSVAEDDEGFVDTVYRTFELSVKAAVQKFGEDNLSEPTRKLYAEKKIDDKIKFLHVVEPRMERDSKKIDPENKPVKSVYIECEANHIVEEGGFDDMPYFVTRYLKWGSQPYGWSPSWIALPEARQVNFLEEHGDAVAEILAYPRVVAPDNLEGDIDLRAGGVTYYNSATGGKPEEWGTAARYDVNSERADRKRRAIEQAYHVDLFQMFRQIDKEMTAREVAERSSEKIMQFSPTFSRMNTELFTPLLRRVFSLLARSGKFPPPPESVIMTMDDGTEVLANPAVEYNSRIARAVKSQENTAWFRTLETVLPLADRDPSVLDNYDFDRIARDAARNDGLPVEWMRDTKTIEQIRKARADAQAAQAQAEQAQKAADAAQKLGTIPPENADRLMEMAS